MSITSLPPDRRREISSKGGKSLRREQRSFFQNRELAREAGRKGGLTPRRTASKLAEEKIVQLAESIAISQPV